MDPLSLAASVAGVVSLAMSVVSTTYKYGSGVMGAFDAQKDFLRELQALAQTLLQVQGVIAGSDASSPQYPRASAEFLSSLDECRKDVEELQAKLEKMQNGGKLKTAMGRLKWPLAEDDTAKAVQRLARYRDLFQNVLTVDTWNLLTRTFSEVVTVKENQESAKQDTESQKAFEWLATFVGNPQIKHQDVVRETISGTGKWLLEYPEFVEFVRGDGDVKSLWCHGLPGAGKTYLFSTVIEHIASRVANPSATVAYWHFDYLQAEKLHPQMFCATLFKQLADYFSHPPPEVNRLYKDRDAKPNPQLPDFSYALFSLLLRGVNAIHRH